MIDISLTTNQLILLIVIFIYMVVTSVVASKFHSFLEQLKKNDLKARHHRMTPETVETHRRLIDTEIKKLKKRSYLILITIGLFHSVVCFILAANILFSLIPFTLFSLVLYGNYWLKGSQVAGFIPSRPGQSDYHG
jgi:uncharacterized protein involved in cysteine biosynthesis